MGAWFHRHDERRAARPITGHAECRDLGVRPARPFVPTLTDDFAVVHDDRADDRVRVRDSAPALGELEGAF